MITGIRACRHRQGFSWAQARVAESEFDINIEQNEHEQLRAPWIPQTTYTRKSQNYHHDNK